MTHASLLYQLHRPIIDLGEVWPESPLSVWGAEFDKRALLEEKDYPRLHVISGASVRPTLLEAIGIKDLQVSHPKLLPEALRNEAWQKLVDCIEAFDDLSAPQQLRTLALLRRLCLYPVIMELTETVERKFPEEQQAMIGYERLIAQYILGMDGLYQYQTNMADSLAKEAPKGSMAAANLWYIVCQQYVKFETNLAALKKALPKYRAAVEAIKAKCPENIYLEFRSRYHRLAAFAPQLEQDAEGMTQEMQTAEDFAQQISINEGNLIEKLHKESVLFPLYESRVKEAIIKEEWKLAEDRAKRLIEIAPYASMPHLHHAQVMAETERYEEAGKAYLKAARLSPMRAAIAYFMAGQCEQLLGRYEQAVAYFFESLRYDEQGVSTVECLMEIARETGDKALDDWASLYYKALTEGEDRSWEQPLMPYQGRLFGEKAPVAQ